jgi:hypothetical protein
VAGFAKDPTPFGEFLWADFLRSRVAESKIRKSFAKATDRAKAVAHSLEALYLPGGSGLIESCR